MTRAAGGVRGGNPINTFILLQEKCSAKRATSVPVDFMQNFMQVDLFPEAKSDSTVVGPAGGTLLFLLTLTPSYCM